MEDTKHESRAITLGLNDLSLIDRARALCVAADDVQRATIEATRRIAAIHGSSVSSPKKRKRRNNTASQKLEKEPPPDICARPPSDIPPPRGEGWRRLDPVSVVCGSNRICAPARCRRALTRGVEVFLGGEKYCIVPAVIDPGVGFCVTLNRDFEGESNMACMLYLRRKGREAGVTGDRRKGQEADTITPTRKVKSPRSTCPSLSTPVPTLEEHRPAVGAGDPLRMCTIGTEQEFGIFDRLRQENKVGSGNSSTVREARRKARQRAINQRKREIAAAKAKEDVERSTKDPLKAADIERLKATRRAALARVMSVKQQEACRRESQSKKLDEERRRRDAEATAKATALQATIFARAAKAAEANRQRKLEQDLGLQEEARLKRERVAAVLNYDQANVSEREKRVRNETCRRIRREERRRELALRREEDERLEKIRLHEERQRLVARCTPAAKSARSFFSVSDPADREAISSEILDEDSGPTTTSASRAPNDESSSQRPVKTNQCGTFFETRDAKVNAFVLDPSMGGAESHRGQANQSCYHHVRERSSPPSSTEHTHSSTHHYSSDGATGLRRYSDANKGGSEAGKTGGTIRTPGLELTSTSPSCGTGSASASGASVGSNGSNNFRRKKIPTKPVWKRPAVPLSKPYVPIPRKDGTFA